MGARIELDFPCTAVNRLEGKVDPIAHSALKTLEALVEKENLAETSAGRFALQFFLLKRRQLGRF